MDERTHNQILQIMRERGMSGRDDYRSVARELNRRSQMKRKVGKYKPQPKPPEKEKTKRPDLGPMLPGFESMNYTEKVNYILKDLLF